MVNPVGCKLKSRGGWVDKVAKMHDPQAKGISLLRNAISWRRDDIFWNRYAISSPERDISSVKMPFLRWRCQIRRWK